jgi:sulfur carrier protein ThiS
MKIYLDRYFAFYTHSRQSWLEVEIKETARLSDVLAGLGIPIAEVQLAVINGEARDPQTVTISKQDQVKIFPPFGGG